jgi:hypothetical protein
MVNITGTIQDSHLNSWILEYGEGTAPTSYLKLVSGLTNVSDNILYSWNTSNLVEGMTYTLRLTGTDIAGNKKSSSIYVIMSSNAEPNVPTLEITNPANGSAVVNEYTEVTYRLKDGTFKNLLGKLYINNQLVSEETTYGEGLSFDAALFNEGSYNFIHVKAQDEQGNDYYSASTFETTAINEPFNSTINLENASGISVQNGFVSLLRLGYTEPPLPPGGYYTFQESAISPGGTYIGSGAFETKTISFPGTVNTISINAQQNVPFGTVITYHASTDGGVTWQQVQNNEKIDLEKMGSNFKLKVSLKTLNSQYTPSISDLKANIVYTNSGQVFTVDLIDEPEQLTATPNINYMTLLRWDASETPGVSYNVYRSPEKYFTPGPGNLVAKQISETYWNDFNLNYGRTYYYQVKAVKYFNSKLRESNSTKEASATVVSKNEVEKRLGLQDYWGYSTFRTGSGDGYVNVSTGNLLYESTDFVMPGPILAMVMRRSYNSQSTTKTPLGYGWDFSFNTTLLKEYDTFGREVGLLLKDGDGSIHRFIKNSDGTYQSPKGIYMELTEVNNSYKIKRKDNIEYLFDN